MSRMRCWLIAALVAGCSFESPPEDAGFPTDAGTLDATRDAEPPKDAALDADTPDADPDAGSPEDAMMPDAGMPDAGEAIDAGPLCALPLSDCGGTCIDTYEDPMNCGGCGLLCVGSEVCLWGVCAEPPMTFTASVAGTTIIDGGRDCTTRLASGPKLALDATNRLYAAMICDGDAFVATSTTQGQTFGSTVALGLRNVEDLTIFGAGPEQAHLAIGLSSQVVMYARTLDGGRSWSPPRAVDLGPVRTRFDSPPQVVAFKSFVFVTATTLDAAAIRVWRNQDEGAGLFTMTEVEIPASGDATLIDPMGGTLWLAGGDSHELDLARSDDFGRTFSVSSTAASGFARSFALSGDNVYYVSGLNFDGSGVGWREGLNGPLSLIDRPGDTEVTSAPDSRSITTAPDGTVYFTASRNDNSPAHQELLLRAATTSTAVDAERFIVAGERQSPFEFSKFPNTVVLAIPGSSAVAALYTRNGDGILRVILF